MYGRVARAIVCVSRNPLLVPHKMINAMKTAPTVFKMVKEETWARSPPAVKIAIVVFVC